MYDPVDRHQAATYSHERPLLLVIALIVVASIAVLQSSMVGAVVASSVLTLLATLIAAVLGISWPDRFVPSLLKRKRRKR